MKNTCKGCKYFDACGDPERTAPCKGRKVKRITRYYHMVVENIWTGERKEYISKTQGAVPKYPVGYWQLVGVCGYHEKGN